MHNVSEILVMITSIIAMDHLITNG